MSSRHRATYCAKSASDIPPTSTSMPRQRTAVGSSFNSSRMAVASSVITDRRSTAGRAPTTHSILTTTVSPGRSVIPPNHGRLTTSLLHHRQRVGIAGQEPAALWLFAVYRHPMPGELRRFSADARDHGQRVPAPSVRDFADDHDLFQVADATN